jgi:hypothetical protein
MIVWSQAALKNRNSAKHANHGWHISTTSKSTPEELGGLFVTAFMKVIIIIIESVVPLGT